MEMQAEHDNNTQYESGHTVNTAWIGGECSKQETHDVQSAWLQSMMIWWPQSP